LDQVCALVKERRYRVTGTAAREAGALSLEEADIVACVIGLNEAVFYKSMQALNRPGFWQDVYRPEYGGIQLYVKLQLEGAVPDDLVVIIQFKRR